MLKDSCRWIMGEKATLSKRSGVSVQHINNIFNQGRAVSRKYCRILLLVMQDMGKDVTYLDLIDSDITPNPLFGNPIAIENRKRLSNG